MVDIQLGTLILAGATLFGAAVGAFAPEWWRTQVQRRNLRVALKGELDSMIALEQLPTDSEEYEAPGYDMLPTTVFDANADKLGLLSGDEVKDITKFYSAAHTAKSQIEFIQRERSDIQKEVSREGLEAYRETVEATGRGLIKIKKLRMNAIQSIEEHIERAHPFQ